MFRFARERRERVGRANIGARRANIGVTGIKYCRRVTGIKTTDALTLTYAPWGIVAQGDILLINRQEGERLRAPPESLHEQYQI